MAQKLGILSANKLFDRPADPAYLEEWARLLSQPTDKQEEVNESPYIVFRLGSDWFGLSALVISEIASARAVNEVPHKNDSILLGIINLKGQLRFCFSMHNLLGVEKEQTILSPEDRTHYPRLVAIVMDQKLWTFPVDEVDSIYQIENKLMTNVPVNITHSRENYLKGVVELNNRRVCVVNEDMLFKTLDRRFS